MEYPSESFRSAWRGFDHAPVHARVGHPSVCTDRFRSLYFSNPAREQRQLPARLVGYIQRQESKSMNGIFMGGLKISRVAGRGARRCS